MPIVIVRGNKPDKQANDTNQNTGIGYRADEDGEEGLQNAVTRSSERHHNQIDLLADMEDVTNLKVYRISKPNFLDGTTTTTLIGGDIFYHQDMIVAPSSANNLSNSESPRKASSISAAATTTNDNKKSNDPTVLQHIRAFKYKSTRKTEINANKSHFIQQIQDNFMRCKLVKAGQPLAKHIKKPSIDDALFWAIEYVCTHEDSLANHLIHLDERIKDIDGIDRASLQQSSMQVVPIEKSAKGASKPRSGGGNNNTQGMALDSTGQTAKAAKAIPLIQQLESLKNAGTDAFLKSVVIEQPPSSASNRKKGTPNIGGLSLAMNSTYSAPPSASSGPMEPSKPNQTKRSNAPAGRSHRILKAQNQIESDAGSLNAIQESSIGSSSSVPGTSNNFYVDNDDLSATSQADGFPENDNMMNKIKISIDIPPQDGNTKDPATNSKKVTILATTPGAESNNEQGNNNNNNSGGKSPHKQSRSPRGGNKSAPGKPTKYSNAKIDSTNVDTSKITLETQETIEEMKRTKAILAKSLGFTMKIFQKQKQHQDDLTQSVNKKLDRANRHGLHLFQEFEHFEDSKHHGNHQVNFLTAGKDVHRLQLVEAKTSALDDSSFATTSSNIHRDMKFLKEHTKAYVDAKKFTAISKYNWFIIALLRLRDYLKRMNNNNNALPPSCVKCLVIMEQLIGLDFVINKHVFYSILLSTKIFQKDDFRKNIVHQIIDAIREGLDISAEEFVKFLEQNDFQVPPELMNQVRNNSTRNSSARATAAPTTTSSKAVVFASNLEDKIMLPPIESYPMELEMEVVEPPRIVSNSLANVVLSALWSSAPTDTPEIDLSNTKQGILSNSEAIDQFDLDI